MTWLHFLSHSKVTHRDKLHFCAVVIIWKLCWAKVSFLWLGGGMVDSTWGSEKNIYYFWDFLMDKSTVEAYPKESNLLKTKDGLFWSQITFYWQAQVVVCFNNILRLIWTLQNWKPVGHTMQIFFLRSVRILLKFLLISAIFIRWVFEWKIIIPAIK
jgi:hypothetical protein